MSKRYVKSDKSYEKPSEYDENAVAAAMKRLKSKRKVPTSVALDPDRVVAIKQAAEERCDHSNWIAFDFWLHEHPPGNSCFD